MYVYKKERNLFENKEKYSMYKYIISHTEEDDGNYKYLMNFHHFVLLNFSENIDEKFFL